MSKYKKQGIYKVDTLYNKILLISRNKRFYTKFGLNDTFENRINLIFLHISFLIIKLKKKDKNSPYRQFSQKMFDHVFEKIEVNMREIGYGDVTVNKNMKFLVKSFYDILLFCENYTNKKNEIKIHFLSKYLTINNDKKPSNINLLIGYINKYQAFCFDLSKDSVLRGDLNFIIE